jgi:hypothetical protein
VDAGLVRNGWVNPTLFSSQFDGDWRGEKWVPKEMGDPTLFSSRLDMDWGCALELEFLVLDTSLFGHLQLENPPEKNINAYLSERYTAQRIKHQE